MSLRIPNFSILTHLREDSPKKDYLRALNEIARETKDAFARVEDLTQNLGLIQDSFISEGRTGSGLAFGMICYPAGDMWLPADVTDNSKFARGVCIDIVSHQRAVIQRIGYMKFACSSTSVKRGDTLWPDTNKPGYVTDARPDIMAAKFVQEIGTAEATPSDGFVIGDFRPRIEPER